MKRIMQISIIIAALMLSIITFKLLKKRPIIIYTTSNHIEYRPIWADKDNIIFVELIGEKKITELKIISINLRDKKYHIINKYECNTNRLLFGRGIDADKLRNLLIVQGSFSNDILLYLLKRINNHWESIPIKGNIILPDLSINGDKLTFITHKKINVITINDYKNLMTIDAHATSLDISGDMLAYTELNKVYVINIKKNKNGPLIINLPTAFTTHVEWAPNNKQIAVLMISNTKAWRIGIVNQDGKLTDDVVFEDIQDIRGPISWSPSGNMIAFTASEPLDIFKSSLCIYNKTQKKIMILSKSKQYWYGPPAWSPNGTMIAVPVRSKNNKSHIMLFSR